jgi:nucleotide-binding universal stress UspA family protein
MARQASDFLRRLFPSWEVRANVAVGSVVRNVVKKTKLWGPDLLVIGLDESLSGAKSCFGSVMQRIATKVPCSIHISRELDVDPDEKPRVLLCVDSSTRADVILSAVSQRKWLKGTELRLLTAVDPFDYSIPELLDNAIDEARARQRLMANELSHTPGFTSALVREGEATRVILAEASEWNPDVIFLAPRNHYRLRRLLLSSVSSRVIAQARCAVELVRTEPTSAPKLGYRHVPVTSPAYD